MFQEFTCPLVRVVRSRLTDRSDRLAAPKNDQTLFTNGPFLPLTPELVAQTGAFYFVQQALFHFLE